MALTVSSVETTVFGNMRIVMGTITDAGTGADEFDTGLEYVFWCGISAVDGTDSFQVVLNSNNGTLGSSNGEVTVTTSSGTVDGRFIAIGK